MKKFGFPSWKLLIELKVSKANIWPFERSHNFRQKSLFFWGMTVNNVIIKAPQQIAIWASCEQQKKTTIIHVANTWWHALILRWYRFHYYYCGLELKRKLNKFHFVSISETMKTIASDDHRSSYDAAKVRCDE